ncbi:AfsR/SARP family transcriptional regulator [Thalassovita sp.]|uniref:AfsR/SARP family transcriptional regulator n=1 Tax=Thalassovita sp. TaxID=1979401 RepID=UPI003B59D5D1
MEPISEMTKPRRDVSNPSQEVANAAIFAESGDANFVLKALGNVSGHENMLIISENPSFLRAGHAMMRLSATEIGLDREQIVAADVVQALQQWLSTELSKGCFIIDMSWVSKQMQGALRVESWGEISSQIHKRYGLPVISVYNRELIVEDLLQASFRAHQQILVPSGVYENPFWIPMELANKPAGEQMSFVLGRIVPDYAGTNFFERDLRFAAHGADPDWLVRSSKPMAPSDRAERWQIYCLGQLRVYRNGSERIDWNIKGGAPKKTRTLFAYLLTHGERGAHVDRIAELLWAEDGTEKSKRARLHHTVAMLRRTLGRKDAVIRSGDFYRLNPPEGSWVDITSFEQLCRRGVSLFKRGQSEEAQLIYSTAEKLYTGDLFEDIPLDYIDNEQEDWCMARRIWLREVALKLQRDFSALLREKGRLRAALEHCQKGLALDPSSDDVNIETLKVFHAQGRMDAVARQYRQYKKAMMAIGSTPEGSEVQRTYRALTTR